MLRPSPASPAISSNSKSRKRLLPRGLGKGTWPWGPDGSQSCGRMLKFQRQSGSGEAKSQPLLPPVSTLQPPTKQAPPLAQPNGKPEWKGNYKSVLPGASGMGFKDRQWLQGWRRFTRITVSFASTGRGLLGERGEGVQGDSIPPENVAAMADLLIKEES